MSQTREVENERLLVKVNDHGGELAGIYDKENNKELIWCGEESVWNRQAPLLFPFVGEVYNKEYHYEGKTYPMTPHGFARDSKFEFEGVKDQTILHTLSSTEETKKIYPFDFKLEVSHKIEANKVIVEWKVKNTGDKEMLFSIGAHPAFNVPVREGELQKDYYLSFDEKEKLDYIRISKDGGTALYEEVHALCLEDGMYQVGEHLFDDGVLIFENHQLSKVGIAFPDKKPYITIECKGFPYVGVWTKPTAPFICLEPWFGRCDNYGFTGELKDKTGVLSLPAKEEFQVAYEIIVG